MTSLTPYRPRKKLIPVTAPEAEPTQPKDFPGASVLGWGLVILGALGAGVLARLLF
jgi:hypothetical protein